jgi:small basic protein (TIGR04137 family)
MSLHRSLKTKPSALNQHRNVLTRAERIAKLQELGRFSEEEQSPIGLVKVANRMVANKKKKTEKVEGAEGEAAAPAADAKKGDAKKGDAKK